MSTSLSSSSGSIGGDRIPPKPIQPFSTLTTTSTETESNTDIDETHESNELHAAANHTTATRLDSHLPTHLHTEGYNYGIRILHDRLTVIYTHTSVHELDVGTVRSNRRIPKPREGCNIFYYEVEILSTGEKSQITIGLAPLQSSCLFAPSNMHSLHTPTPSQASLRQHDTASLTCRPVGSDNLSYGYKSVDGKKYHGPPSQPDRPIPGAGYGPPFIAGDVVGCGVNYYDQSVFFTRNGQHLGVAFTLQPSEWSKVDGKECRDPMAAPIDERLDFYAAVSLHSKDEQVKLNFCQRPFVFDLESFQASELVRIRNRISSKVIDSNVILPLIRSYLICQGYRKSLDALNRITNSSKLATSSTDVEDDDRTMKDVTPSTSDASPSAVASSNSKSSNSSIASQVSSSSPSDHVSSFTAHDRLAYESMDERLKIRELIQSNRVSEAIEAIQQFAPNLLQTSTTHPNPSIDRLHLRLLSLQFVAILLNSSSSTRILNAISFAQQHFRRFQESTDDQLRSTVNSFMGMLAYNDIRQSPFDYLTRPTYRDEISEEVNRALIAYVTRPDPTGKVHSRLHGFSTLEIAIRQAATVESVGRQRGYPIAMPTTFDQNNTKEVKMK